MGDFPLNWRPVRELPGGGQGHTFVVRRANEPDEHDYVFKRLINPKRQDRFAQEIETCKSLKHPNIVKIIENGNTPKGRPYLISEYCVNGSLDRTRIAFERPLAGLNFFKWIVRAIAYAHGLDPAISHLDLKPTNIFLKDSETPVVGDFGICYIEGDTVAITSEGQHGSAYYCAPELRGPKIDPNVDARLGDVYSLGKLLYWVFTKDVYDGSEEDYSDNKDRSLACRFPEYPQFAFVDEIIRDAIRRRPSER